MDPFDTTLYKNQRTITVRYRFEGEEMHVLSTLADEHHDIQVFLRISTRDQKILEARGQMQQRPFPDCLGALGVLQKLIGLQIGLGVKKEYFRRFEKKDGCTHLSEIFLATVDYIFARLYGPKLVSSEAEKNQRRRLGAEVLSQNNSCHIFNRDNLPYFDENGRYKGKTYHY